MVSYVIEKEDFDRLEKTLRGAIGALVEGMQENARVSRVIGQELVRLAESGSVDYERLKTEQTIIEALERRLDGVWEHGS